MKAPIDFPYKKLEPRNFLTDVRIVGALLVSRESEILYYTITNLLKWCDWIIIMFDNESKDTRRICERYKVNFPDRIRLARTNIEGTTKEQEKANPKILFRRFKPIQGLVRDKVFQYLHNCVKRGEKIEMIIWPDADEVFSDYFPQLLEEFWAMKEKTAIALKPVDVFGDFKTIRMRSMSPHIRVMKYSPDLTAVPFRSLCTYLPITGEQKISRTRITIHLTFLSQEKRIFRLKNWRNTTEPDEKLCCLDKDVRTMSMPEIREAEEKGPYTTVKEYLIKYKLKI